MAAGPSNCKSPRVQTDQLLLGLALIYGRETMNPKAQIILKYYILFIFIINYIFHYWNYIIPLFLYIFGPL